MIYIQSHHETGLRQIRVCTTTLSLTLVGVDVGVLLGVDVGVFSSGQVLKYD